MCSFANITQFYILGMCSSAKSTDPSTSDTCSSAYTTNFLLGMYSFANSTDYGDQTQSTSTRITVFFKFLLFKMATRLLFPASKRPERELATGGSEFLPRPLFPSTASLLMAVENSVSSLLHYSCSASHYSPSVAQTL